MRNSISRNGEVTAPCFQRTTTRFASTAGGEKKEKQNSKNEFDVSAGMCCGFEKKAGSCSRSPVASGVCVRPLDPALPARAIIPRWMFRVFRQLYVFEAEVLDSGVRSPTCVCDCS